MTEHPTQHAAAAAWKQLVKGVVVGLVWWAMTIVAITQARYGYAALFLACAGCSVWAIDDAVKRIEVIRD